MLNKNILVAHFESVVAYPPIINLLNNLLNNGWFVNLVSLYIDKLPDSIVKHSNFNYIDISVSGGENWINKAVARFKIKNRGRYAIEKYMLTSDILWVTTDRTAALLGKMVYKYKYVLQLMELDKYYPYFRSVPFLKFPIEKMARKAYKVVVPEINRAYIQKVWWNLQDVPIVLPNKPYFLDHGELDDDQMCAIEKMKKDTRKKILYLGVIGLDREFTYLVDGLKKMGDKYCLYIVGKYYKNDHSEFNKWVEDNDNVEYLGYYSAPKHLAFLEYAHIGLLPYKPSCNTKYISELNALYCAPNKIFEYSGYGVPMLGTDVLGLKLPFEMYNIGECYDENSDSVCEAIKKIESNYNQMKVNCYKYFDSVNLDEIVERILTD